MDSLAFNELPDPRVWPTSATPEQQSVYEQVGRSLAAETGAQAAEVDRAIATDLRLLRAEPQRLAELLSRAPSAAVHRYLWRAMAEGSDERADMPDLSVRAFALPLVIVVGSDDTGPALSAALPAELTEPGEIATILREHGALRGNQAFGLANALASAQHMDVGNLGAFDAWQTRLARGNADATLAFAPEPITVEPAHETVHLRFLVGAAVVGAKVDLFGDPRIARWGTPLAQSISRQLKRPGATVLALPRAPASPLVALAQGRSAQREVSLLLFVAQALRRLRASVGEPAAVLSAHRAPDTPLGGELRLSLSSPFSARDSEGHRLPLSPLDSVADVARTVVDLLDDCRVAQVRIQPGVHPHRDATSGLLRFFRYDEPDSVQTLQ